MVNPGQGPDAGIVPNPGQKHTEISEGSAISPVLQETPDQIGKYCSDCPKAD